jgi:bacillithiol synthase
LTNEKQAKKADKLSLTWADLFSKQSDLLNKQTAKLSEIKIDFTIQKEHLQKQFETLLEIAKQTDKSFLGAVLAQQKKQIHGLENLEKRLLKAQKRKYNDTLERILDLQNELFPNKSLQERKSNFSEFYLDIGNDLIDKLTQNLKPLSNEFNVVIL